MFADLCWRGKSRVRNRISPDLIFAIYGPTKDLYFLSAREAIRTLSKIGDYRAGRILKRGNKPRNLDKVSGEVILQCWRRLEDKSEDIDPYRFERVKYQGRLLPTMYRHCLTNDLYQLPEEAMEDLRMEFTGSPYINNLSYRDRVDIEKDTNVSLERLRHLIAEATNFQLKYILDEIIIRDWE